MEFPILPIALFVFYAGLSQYVFRFQRTTRGVSQTLLGRADSELQMLLTPNWMGALGWASTAVGICAAYLSWHSFGWTGALGVLAYAMVGGAIVDTVSPLPTYRHCFDVIESCVTSDPTLSVELGTRVRAIRNEHGH